MAYGGGIGGRNRHWRKKYLNRAMRLGGKQFNCLACLHPVASHDNGVCSCWQYVTDLTTGERTRSRCKCTKRFEYFAPLKQGGLR